jgi:hypothetical protein
LKTTRIQFDIEFLRNCSFFSKFKLEDQDAFIEFYAFEESVDVKWALENAEVYE